MTITGGIFAVMPSDRLARDGGFRLSAYRLGAFILVGIWNG